MYYFFVFIYLSFFDVFTFVEQMLNLDSILYVIIYLVILEKQINILKKTWLLEKGES